MISNGDVVRDKRDHTAIAGLIAGILLMVAAAAIAFGWRSIMVLQAFREHPSQATEAQCVEGADCDRKSLRADVRSAAATETAADAAIWQLMLNMIGLVGLGLTVYYARRAWVAAASSAKAAEDTYKAMIQSEQRQLRAYVSLTKISFEINSLKDGYDFKNFFTPGSIFKDFVILDIKNYGQTPAKKVCAYAFVIELPYLADISESFDFDAAFDKLQKINTLSYSYLSREQIETVMIGPIDATAYWRALDNKSSLMVYGRIFYEDAYDRAWSTQYCFTWEPWHGGGPRFVPHDRFNGEDLRRAPKGR